MVSQNNVVQFCFDLIAFNMKVSMKSIDNFCEFFHAANNRSWMLIINIRGNLNNDISHS